MSSELGLIRDFPVGCHMMSEIGNIDGDESLNNHSNARLKRGGKAPRNSASSASKSLPRSVTSVTTTTNNSKPNRSGSAVTVKSRDKNTQRQRQQRRGSRIRGGGERISSNANSSSAPQLPRAAATTIADDKNNGDYNTNSSVDEKGGSRRHFERKSTGSTVHNINEVVDRDFKEEGETGQAKTAVEAKDAARLLQELESRKREIEARHRPLENRCTQLEVELSSKSSELKSYKAEVRAKTIAVGKAEMILNEVCLSMARRVGRAEGTQMSDNKGAILLEVHENPAEFATQIKKNITAQISKWDIDRVALQASAELARDKATEAAEVHEAERVTLSARVELLQETIRVMELDSQRLVAEAEIVAEESRKDCQAASSVKDELVQELEAAEVRNKELCQTVEGNEMEFQAQLDRFMEYPKAAERMAEELDKCEKSARREKNLMELERKEFRRQLHMFQKWQTENKDLREKVKAQEMQVLSLRRQLAVTESGLAGSASTRKAVIGGTVDRLQRAETAAKHQAHKYRDLAGTRGVQVAQLKTEVSSLKATISNLRHKVEPPAHDSYQTEIARFARANPEVLEIQQKSGLDEEDMQASMAQLMLLREKEEQKDALIALARERDDFELCIKDLRARNSWLEKQVLRTPEALRSVAEERLAAVAQSEEAGRPKRAESIYNGGWMSTQNGRGKEDVHATLPRKSQGATMMENQSDARRGQAEAVIGSTARIRRNIQFLEECDWSIEKQRDRETSAANNNNRRRGGGGGGGSGGGGHGPVAAVYAVRRTSRPRPRSAQGLSRPPSSSSPPLR